MNKTPQTDVNIVHIPHCNLGYLDKSYNPDEGIFPRFTKDLFDASSFDTEQKARDEMEYALNLLFDYGELHEMIDFEIETYKKKVEYTLAT